MKKELQLQLQREFPNMFVDLWGDPRTTCMAWGCCVGDGWYDLIYKLCSDIKTLNPPENFKWTQIKEKFGGLRAYWVGATTPISQLVDEAERDSYTICEDCGSKENVTSEGGWIRTLCKKCREEN